MSTTIGTLRVLDAYLELEVVLVAPLATNVIMGPASFAQVAHVNVLLQLQRRQHSEVT